MRKQKGETGQASTDIAPYTSIAGALSQHLGDQSAKMQGNIFPYRRETLIVVLLTACALLPILVFGLGFALFMAKTMNINLPPATVKTDAIIVLTGGRARLETGFELLQKGRGKRLLISGVSPIIRGRHNVAQILAVNPALLECCVDLGWEALNTSGNAAESATWVKKNGYKAVLIVTNRYHMLRSLAELRHTMPQTELVPYPVERAGGLFQSPENFRLFASEYSKFLVVTLRNLIP